MMMFGFKKKKWRLSICQGYNTFSMRTLHATFGSELEARDERNKIYDKWMAVKKERHNDPETYMYRLKAGESEFDFDLRGVNSIILGPKA
jgi:hypothetical protein